MPRRFRQTIWGAALLILAAVIVYLPSLRGGMIWDDDTLIFQNPSIRAADGLWQIWFANKSLEYYPLTYNVWWLFWHGWGDQTTGYRICNVLLHAVNAVLIWRVLKRLRIPGAWLAALVFAVHPVNVATVAWISELKNTLSMLFYLLAARFYLEFHDAPRPHWYGAALGCFLLALLSKPAVVMLPVALLLCVWWQQNRLERRDWVRTLPFFLLSLVMGLVTIWHTHAYTLAGQATRNEGFFGRLATAGWAVWFYIYKAVLPVGLSVLYPQWTVNAANPLAYLPGLALVGCLILFWRQRRTWGRGPLFALAYVMVTLFPVLGFVDQGFYKYSLVSDHWQYFSIVGIIALVVGGGVWLSQRTLIVVVLIAGLLMTLTWQRSRIYGNAERLWRDTLRKNPNAWVAHNNLGLSLFDQGRIDDALAEYAAALQIKTDNPKLYRNMGLALAAKGQVQPALASFNKALQLDPSYAAVYADLGNLWTREGQLERACRLYGEALLRDPNLFEAHYNRGVVLAMRGKFADAIPHFRQAVSLRPDLPEVRAALATAEAKTR